MKLYGEDVGYSYAGRQDKGASIGFREYLAALAMQGICANDPWLSDTQIAQKAVSVADSMIEVLKAGNEGRIDRAMIRDRLTDLLKRYQSDLERFDEIKCPPADLVMISRHKAKLSAMIKELKLNIERIDSLGVVQ